MKTFSKRTAQRRLKAAVETDMNFIRHGQTEIEEQSPHGLWENNNLTIPIIHNLGFIDSVFESNLSAANINLSTNSVTTDSVSTNSEVCTFLSSWALKHNVTHDALKELLGYLRTCDELKCLPKDPRTLLQTPKLVKKVSVSGGECIYLDIVKSIEKKLKANYTQSSIPFVKKLHEIFHERLVSVAIGIDGIPVTNSTNRQFWPVLFSVDQSPGSAPLVAAIFHGSNKPTNTDFLKPLIDQIKSLEVDGILINNKKFTFRISRVLADAPARSLIKGIRNHNSYEGCERCTQVGEWSGRVVYPYTSQYEVRLDINFIDYDRNNSRHISSQSVFSDLKLGLVTQVPLDYLHLVCLGVARKLVRTWVKGKIPHKIRASDVQRISQRFLSFRKHFPSCFQRKPRSLDEVMHFKGTEYRTILLYTGVAAFYKILDSQKFNHFLLFHTSIYILLSDKANENYWNSLAKEFLRKFVMDTELIYGKEFITYNMHGLLHIHDDALTFGSLDNASTFHFESYMQKIKRVIRGNNYYIEQAFKRICELEALPENISSKTDSSISKRSGNNCFLLSTGEIIQVLDMITNESGTIITRCVKFKSLSRVKEYPLDSRNLGIYKVDKLSHPFDCFINCESILLKYVCLPFCKSYICIPLLHSKY